MPFESLLKPLKGTFDTQVSLTNTSFNFQVPSPHFSTCLDSFASYLHEPALNLDPEVTNSLIDKIHKKFEDGQKSDSVHLSNLMAFIADQDSCLNRMINGNKATLETFKESKAALIEFHKQWYSANLMCLTIYSNTPLEELDIRVTSAFEKIKNLNAKIPNMN